MSIVGDIRNQAIRLARRRVERAARRRIQSHPLLWRDLEAYLAKTESTGCQFADYDALYQSVRERQPRELLECGTGASTLVLAQALLDNRVEHGREGRVTSMEEIPYWFDMATKLLPDRLRENVELCQSPPTEDGYTLFRGVRYAELPERAYDWVFVDGPSTLAPSDATRCAQLDFLHVVRHSEGQVYGIVDARLTTSYVLQKVFPQRFHFDAVRKLAFVGPVGRRDMHTIHKTSSKALSHSLRLFAPTRLRLRMEAPEPQLPQSQARLETWDQQREEDQ